eukprot:12273-Heterococcus_DN1.PRE.7
MPVAVKPACVIAAVAATGISSALPTMLPCVVRFCTEQNCCCVRRAAALLPQSASVADRSCETTIHCFVKLFCVCSAAQTSPRHSCATDLHCETKGIESALLLLMVLSTGKVYRASRGVEHDNFCPNHATSGFLLLKTRELTFQPALRNSAQQNKAKVAATQRLITHRDEREAEEAPGKKER